jgi:hypothetical protein
VRFRKNKTAAAAELFIKTAQRYLGYSPEMLGRNMFGNKVGYDSVPWAGAFIDVCAREAGLKIPAFTYTPAALAEFIRSGNFSRVPRPGSVAIFNFSSNVGHAASAFSMPHCGIVVDVREFGETGKYVTVEGNATGQSPQQNKDGVHQRIRTINEVLVFCHPEFDRRKGSQTFNERLIKIMDRGRTKFDGSDLKTIDEASKQPEILKLNGEVRYGDRNKKIEIIQLALATVTDIRGAQPGKWDQVTAAACSRYQRNIGYVGKDVTGQPDRSTLARLSKDTDLFSLDPESKIN